jgi:hypothetical protein
MYYYVGDVRVERDPRRPGLWTGAAARLGTISMTTEPWRPVMHPQGTRKISAFAVLFLGVFATCIVGILGGTAIALYGMRIARGSASELFHLAGETIDGLPSLIEALPPVVSDTLHDRRAPNYADQLTVRATLQVTSDGRGLRPSLTISNNGTEMVTFLSLRVAALDEDGDPLRDWSDVVATPVALDDWPGPILPGHTRHIMLGSYRGGYETGRRDLTASVEITDVRVWDPKAKEASLTSVSQSLRGEGFAPDEGR